MHSSMNRLAPSAGGASVGRIAPLAIASRRGLEVHKYSGRTPWPARAAGTTTMPAGQPAPTIGAPGGGPPGNPPVTSVPATPTQFSVGSPSWPQQWQQQSAILSQNVSTPVNVVTQPQVSLMFTPQGGSGGDLGPVYSSDAVLGMRAAVSKKCLLWGLAGVAAALFFGARSRD